jgi:hypothetical protein
MINEWAPFSGAHDMRYVAATYTFLEGTMIGLKPMELLLGAVLILFVLAAWVFLRMKKED